MSDFKRSGNVIRTEYLSPRIADNLFRHPYTKVAFIEKDLKVSRATATRYLEALTKNGILKKHKLGRENYYVNSKLIVLLFNISEGEAKEDST